MLIAIICIRVCWIQQTVTKLYTLIHKIVAFGDIDLLLMKELHLVIVVLAELYMECCCELLIVKIKISVDIQCSLVIHFFAPSESVPLVT